MNATHMTNTSVGDIEKKLVVLSGPNVKTNPYFDTPLYPGEQCA